MAKAKAKKVRTIPKPPAEGDEYQLDMEIPLRGPGGWGVGPILGWGWAEARFRGTEEMCQSIAKDWKRNGCGGRLLRLDGTPDGELIEQWASIGRLEWSAAQEPMSK